MDDYIAHAIRRFRNSNYADAKLLFIRLIEAHLSSHGPAEVDGEVWSVEDGIVVHHPAEVKP